MSQPLKYSSHNDLENVSGSEGIMRRHHTAISRGALSRLRCLAIESGLIDPLLFEPIYERGSRAATVGLWANVWDW